MDLQSVFIQNHEFIFRIFFAFCVGFLGSAAYITALYFKFIGENEENRSVVLAPFLQDGFESKLNLEKSSWYCVIGGLIAAVFQVDVPNFVAIQSLILGATWPAIVSQFLSGRMTKASNKELEEALEDKAMTEEEEEGYRDYKEKLEEIFK